MKTPKRAKKHDKKYELLRIEREMKKTTKPKLITYQLAVSGDRM